MVADESIATIIEKFHRFTDGVKINPVVFDNLFPSHTYVFNLCVPKIFKMVLVFCV